MFVRSICANVLHVCLRVFVCVCVCICAYLCARVWVCICACVARSVQLSAAHESEHVTRAVDAFIRVGRRLKVIA